MSKTFEFNNKKYEAVEDIDTTCVGCCFSYTAFDNCDRPSGINSCVQFLSPEESEVSRDVIFKEVKQ